MIRRSLSGAVTVALGIYFLTACTMNGNTMERVEAGDRTSASSSPSLARAKALSMAVTAEIAASVPDAVIASSRVVTKSHLLQCGHSDRYQWPGFTDLTLVDGSDVEAVLSGLARDWASRRGFEASREVDPDGTSSVTINAEHGINVYAFAEDSGRVLSLNSFSPCFDLPDGNLFDEY